MSQTERALHQSRIGADATGPDQCVPLLQTLRAIVGRNHVLSARGATLPYRTGYRFGGGPAVAVVRPGTLIEQWKVLQACLAADAVIIMQAANTGLTGGSTPCDGYDRPVVIVNTKRLSTIHVLGDGRQVLCLPGATLHGLERKLAPLGREPHSVIGSSCLGASVIGGVCNNSGGSLIQRGPAFTELALFARVDERGRLALLNHLDMRLGEEPEEILGRLDRGDFDEAHVGHDPARRACYRDYARNVRDIDAPTPARFNANPECLFEASGCAGKLAVFAVRLDTFPVEQESAVFYIGTNSTSDLTVLRRRILQTFADLPVSAEYIHRTAFDIARVYGKDTVLAIKLLGTRRLPALFRLKAHVDRAAVRLGLGAGFSDRLMQRLGRLFRELLPTRMLEFRDLYEHHLILKMAGPGIGEARDLLTREFRTSCGWFECKDEEAKLAFLHRFAVAGAAIRYRTMHEAEVGEIIALDIALPRDRRDWFERLPPDIDDKMRLKLYYGHFFCHVFHHDYIVAKDCDASLLEQRMLVLLDEHGAEYPAEHNVGHKYPAKPALAAFYRELDPCNQLNPGIGHGSKQRFWR